MKKLLKRLWADPVWSKVISGLILAILASPFIIGWWDRCVAAIAAVWKFLGETTVVVNWLLIVLCLCASGVVMVVIVALVGDRSAPTLSWKHYLLDAFLNILWRWRYTSDGTIYDVCPFCPRCDLQINPHPSGYIGAGITVFECDACDFERRIDKEYNEIEHLIKRYIQQKLRDDSWRQLPAFREAGPS